MAAAVLLFLFALSPANSALDQPKNDFFSTYSSIVGLPYSDPSTYSTIVGLPYSDPKPGAAILLPSERPETEPATFVEFEPEETQVTDSKSHETKQDEEKSVSVSESQTDSLPLTTVFTLRPINRHFSRGSFFPIRRGYKCHGHRRHHHLHQFKQRFAGQRFNGQPDQISFGNDMILAKDQDRGFNPGHPADGQRLERWAKYHHGGQRVSLTNDDTIRQELYGMSHAQPHFHHRPDRHRRHHRDEDDEEEEEEDRHEHENGIINGIRRFLNF